MGCTTSKGENEGTVARCKQRKRLIKAAVDCRHQFAVSHLAYMKALRNAGGTLRQFAEMEGMREPEAQKDYLIRSYRPSVTPFQSPLPPPPPPPPPLSLTPSPLHPQSASADDSSLPANVSANPAQLQDCNSPRESDTESLMTPVRSPPPPPPPQGSPWDFWYPFSAAACYPPRISDLRRASRGSFEDLKRSQLQKTEGEESEEAATEEFAEEGEKSFRLDTDDNTSLYSYYTKDSDFGMMMVLPRKWKSLLDIIKEVHDCFLRASEGGADVSRLLETNKFVYFQHCPARPNKFGCRCAKVFSAFLWGWGSKSSAVTSRESPQKNEADSRRSHCLTLERLYSLEKRLYQQVRSGALAKIELEKKRALLQRRESRRKEEAKIIKTRETVRMLESEISALKEAANKTLACILSLRDNELYPQLLELSQGLTRMWRCMYECHHLQNNLVQQINDVQTQTDANTEGTSSFHRQATIQLETQVSSWHRSFCDLVKSQRNYIQALNGWMKLSLQHTDADTVTVAASATPMSVLLDDLQQAVDKLPNKAAAEAINGFLTIIHATVQQHAEEHKQRKKTEILSRQLEKKLLSVEDAERKLQVSERKLNVSVPASDPLAQKKAKIDAFRRRVDDQKMRHLESMRTSRSMTLNNLQAGLPNVFLAMTSFSSVCMHSFHSLHLHSQTQTQMQNQSFRFDVVPSKA